METSTDSMQGQGIRVLLRTLCVLVALQIVMSGGMLGLMAWREAGRSEMTYQGRPESEWRRMTQDADEATRTRAIFAVNIIASEKRIRDPDAHRAATTPAP